MIPRRRGPRVRPEVDVDLPLPLPPLPPLPPPRPEKRVLAASKAHSEDRGWRGEVARDVLEARHSAQAVPLYGAEDRAGLADCVSDLAQVLHHLGERGHLSLHAAPGPTPGPWDGLRADAEAVRDQLGRALLNWIEKACPGA